METASTALMGSSSSIVGMAVNCASETIRNLRKSESAEMKLRKSYKYLSRFVRRQPSMVICSIKLTSNCTQNCLQCSIPSHADGQFLKLHDFETIIRKLKEYGTNKITLTGGEPAIHPQLEEIYRLLDQYGFHGSNLLTNLYYPPVLQDKVIDLSFEHNVQINTSYDAVDETADLIRGAKDVAPTVERGMHRITAIKRRIGRMWKPTATVVISELNIRQIPLIIQRIQELGWWMNIDVYRWTSEFHQEDERLKIRDLELLDSMLHKVRKAPNLLTPVWIYDGVIDYLKGKRVKICPYLQSPTFGSKFFISDKGDLQVCMGGSVGNLLHQTPAEIFASVAWKEKRGEFRACQGCWNTCYSLVRACFNICTFPR